MTLIVSAISARNGLLDELLEPAQRRARCRRGSCRCRRGGQSPKALSRSIASAPRISRPIRGQVKRGAHEIGERDRAVVGPQRHEVRCPALQLTSFFDEDDPIRTFGHLRKKCVRQRRFASRSAAGDQDVLARCNRIAQRAGLLRS